MRKFYEVHLWMRNRLQAIDTTLSLTVKHVSLVNTYIQTLKQVNLNII